jgi:stage II sporulation protein D
VAVSGESIRVRLLSGAVVAEGAGTIAVVPDGRNRLRAGGSKPFPGPFEVDGDRPFSIAGKRLSGPVRILVRQGQVMAVARVPLEEYVAAVLAREAAPAFHPEALAALAVAVRTYGVSAALKPKDPEYDLLPGVEDQVFDGHEGVLPRFREAARATAGLLLRYGDGIAQANFHSACGGATERSLDAWGKPFPYLSSVPCEDCRHSPVWRWEYRMTGEEGRRIAKQAGLSPGADLKIETAGETGSGRAVNVRLSSGRVSREIPASRFRQFAGYSKVRSLRMEISRSGDGWLFRGGGYGHGVGLCQWGADGMAQRGVDHRGILARYYPGTRVAGEGG